MAKNLVILVAGYDYLWSGVSYRQLCLNRMNVILKQNPKLEFDFVLFDTENATLEINQESSGKRTWSALPHTFNSKVTKKNYTIEQGHGRFEKDPKGVMSILDVYQFIQNIGGGKNTAGTLFELSILSHGYIGGPILVNSFDATFEDPKKPRDPNDKDGRAVKDFISPTQSTQALANFKAAFSQNSSIWIWGCAFSTGFRRVILQVIDTPLYKKTAPGKLVDTEVFDFNFTKTEADFFFQYFPSFFPAKVNNQYPLSFKRSFGQIKRFVQEAIATVYPQNIAKATGRPCYGALPGTYSDYEKGKMQYPVMVIPREIPPYSDNFVRMIAFYKTYFGIKEDPEGRGYGTFPF